MKIGKLYDLMAFGDDLDAFYYMCKKVYKPIATQNDLDIMKFIDEAKEDAPKPIECKDMVIMVNGKEQYAIHYPTNEDWIKWFKKWFGE